MLERPWGGMALDMQPEDIFYISLPLFHSNAVHIGFASSLRVGSTMALARRFSVKNFWKDIRKYNATCFNYIGELCRYLLNQPSTPQDREHNVYKICGNGLRPEIWKEFKERFNIRRVHEHYGATEIRGMFCNYFNLDCTIGFNFDPYVIVKYNIDTDEPIQNDNGHLQAVEEGEAGLLLMKIKDDTTFAGYTNKEATNKKILHNPFGNNETLWPQAIKAFLESESYEHSIRLAISIGGDSDTIACINGGIAQAFYGGVPVEITREIPRFLDDNLNDVMIEFCERYNCS